MFCQNVLSDLLRLHTQEAGRVSAQSLDHVPVTASASIGNLNWLAGICLIVVAKRKAFHLIQVKDPFLDTIPTEKIGSIGTVMTEPEFSQFKSLWLIKGFLLSENRVWHLNLPTYFMETWTLERCMLWSWLYIKLVGGGRIISLGGTYSVLDKNSSTHSIALQGKHQLDWTMLLTERRCRLVSGHLLWIWFGLHCVFC